MNRFEENYVWNFVYSELKFSPDVIPRYVTINIDPPAFVLPNPFRIYDMRTLSDAWEQSADKQWNEKIENIFESMITTCMKTVNRPAMKLPFSDLFGFQDRSNYVYALDWHHTCYRYYPMNQSRGEMDKFSKVSFFPDGDYQFFLAADFSWGYLAHPWQEGIYAYGHTLIEYLDEYESELLLTLKYKS